MSNLLPLQVSTFECGVIYGPASAPKQTVYEESETQKYALGTKFVCDNGTIYRYAKNGAAALTKAHMTQTQVVAAAYILEVAQTGHAQVVGAQNIITLVVTGSSLARNSLDGGTLWANKTGNLGESYKILSSALRPGSDTLLDLVLETPIRVAIAADTEVSISPNYWYGVVTMPIAAKTGSPAGIPLINVTASYYFWACTGGDCPIYIDTDEVAIIGNTVGYPATYEVAGCGGVWQTLMPIWGIWRTVNAGDEVGLIGLTIDH